MLLFLQSQLKTLLHFARSRGTRSVQSKIFPMWGRAKSMLVRSKKVDYFYSCKQLGQVHTAMLLRKEGLDFTMSL